MRKPNKAILKQREIQNKAKEALMKWVIVDSKTRILVSIDIPDDEAVARFLKRLGKTEPSNPGVFIAPSESMPEF